jgi:hypothetical protein
VLVNAGLRGRSVSLEAFRATDTDAGVKALVKTLLATVTDPAAKEALLRLTAGADPSTALKVPKSQAAAVDAEGEAGDQHDTHKD